MDEKGECVGGCFRISNEFSENERGRASSRGYECVRLSQHSKFVFSKNVFTEIKPKKKKKKEQAFVFELSSYSLFHNCVQMMLRITEIQKVGRIVISFDSTFLKNFFFFFFWKNIL